MELLTVVGHTIENSQNSPKTKGQLRIERITTTSPRSPSPHRHAKALAAIEGRTTCHEEGKEEQGECGTTRDWGGSGRVPFSARPRLFCYDEMIATMSGAPGSHQYTAIFGEGNNVQVVIKALTNGRPWKAIVSEVAPFPTVSWVSLLWKQTSQCIKWDQLCEGAHMVNHFRFAREISTKGQLLRNMIDLFRSKQQSPFQHLPLSFLIGDSTQKTDMKNFTKIQSLMKVTGEKYVRLEEERVQREKNGEEVGPVKNKHFTVGGYHLPATFGFDVWIAKPQCMSRGRGIHVFSSIEELTRIVSESSKKKSLDARLKWSWINRPSNITSEEEQTLMREKLKRKKRFGYDTDSSDEEESPLRKSQSGIDTRSQSCSSSPARLRGYFKVVTNGQGDVPVTSWIIQKYIERPLLITGRKFDIRVFVVVTPSLHVYMCKEGYVRTAARKYNLAPQNLSDSFMHLCNNAIQKAGEDYSKYEDGNQLSFDRFQAYLDTTPHKGLSVKKQMVPRMQELVSVSMQAVRNHFLRPAGSTGIFKQISFQLFGYDFMVDDEGELFLIEVNSNPCLEESSALLSDLIPRMLDEMFSLCLDNTLKMCSPRELELFELLVCLKSNQVFPDGAPTPPEALKSKLRGGLSGTGHRSSTGNVRASSVTPKTGARNRAVSPVMRRNTMARTRKMNVSDHRCPKCFRL